MMVTSCFGTLCSPATGRNTPLPWRLRADLCQHNVLRLPNEGHCLTPNDVRTGTCAMLPEFANQPVNRLRILEVSLFPYLCPPPATPPATHATCPRRRHR